MPVFGVSAVFILAAFWGCLIVINDVQLHLHYITMMLRL